MFESTVEEHGSVEKSIAFMFDDYCSGLGDDAVSVHSVKSVSISWSQVSHCRSVNIRHRRMETISVRL